ncbi:MAG: ribose-5-phosphate isomerase RpiA [Trueperaceae bacterium]|nr:ribose-5-phosphate isomerase RpiA [Trueperaceae bacterium]
MTDLESLKKQAALKALEHVQSNMLVGLGTGSTAKYFIAGLGEKLAKGDLKNISAIATSKASEDQAIGLGIPMVELEGQSIDLAIDGMDEVDPHLNAIKGLGGALTREKMVESCARFFILIGDETKTVQNIGEKAPIPVEVVQFAWKATQKKLEALDTRPVLRLKDGKPFVTDNGNFILDCHIRPPREVFSLAQTLSATPGVVEHGLFLDMAQIAYIATQTDILVMTKDS